MAFELDHRHGLPAEEARERLRALGDYLSNKYGLSVSWPSDDEAKITGKYMVVTIDGTVRIDGDRVRFSGKDPGMLWRGKAKDYLGRKLAKYLDGSTPVADLPRR